MVVMFDSTDFTEKFTLFSDLAGEFPFYLHLSQDKKRLCYSRSLKSLLDSSLVPKPLSIASENISFLLQSGMVPLPNSIYKNIYILGIGDKVTVSRDGEKIHLDFTHEFPFSFYSRQSKDYCVPDVSRILQLLAEATMGSLKRSESNYLFQSAGKDSNMLVLALAEAGWQDRILCLSHASKSGKDESKIASQIAHRLGFRHQTLIEPSIIEDCHRKKIGQYFREAPLPCMDNVSLAYPLYAVDLNFSRATIIDGSGNDIYIGHIPSYKEYISQKIFPKLSWIRNLNSQCRFGSPLYQITRSRAEICGLFGMPIQQAENFYNTNLDVQHYWLKFEKLNGRRSYLDYRARVRGVSVDTEIFIRKVRNFADAFSCQPIFPWMNESVAKYFFALDEKYLFDVNKFKNKIILREILKQRLDLDCDSLGKIAYEFDFYGLLKKLGNDVSEQIFSCSLFENKQKKVILSLCKRLSLGEINKYDVIILHRLFLLSGWFNCCKYLH